METTKVVHKKKVLAPKLRFKDFNEGWKSSNYKELTSMVTNGFVGVAKEHYVTSDGIIYIQGYNIVEGGFNLHGIKQVSREFDFKNKKSKLQFEDLLTIQTGDIGVTSVVTETLVGSNCHALVISRFNKNIAAPKFYMFYFNSERGRRMLKVIETGSTMKHLNVGDIIKLQVPFPSLPEQQKIAAFLSAVDEKIQLLKHKKKLLEQYKKGVMQQLFSGKLRFKPDAVAERSRSYPKWEEKKLGDVFEFFRGSPISKSDLCETGKYSCIHYGELFTSYFETINNIKSRTNLENGFFSKQGDILMPSSDVTPKGLAKASSIQLDNIILGGDMNILRPFANFNSIFFSYLLNFNQQKIIQKVTGTTVKHIYNRDVKLLKFDIPSSFEEQKKIADFLSAIDIKIETVAEALEATAKYKKGLLQQMFV